MEDLYTYLGYIVIAVLIYLIYITLFPSTTSEGFMGFGSDSDSDSKGKKNSKSNNKNSPPVAIIINIGFIRLCLL